MFIIVALQMLSNTNLGITKKKKIQFDQFIFIYLFIFVNFDSYCQIENWSFYEKQFVTLFISFIYGNRK